jgi:pyruvate kinase
MPKIRKLITLGPNSLNKKIIKKIEKDTYLFRINLSHISIKDLKKIIIKIKSYTRIPICIDTEGAQIRNGIMRTKSCYFKKNSLININSNHIKKGDNKNISFYPPYIFHKLKRGDIIKIDFDSVAIKVLKKINDKKWKAKVISEGYIGSNKGADLNRNINLKSITDKDLSAINIAKSMGIKHFSFSFADSKKSIIKLKRYTGKKAIIISKIESKKGLKNLKDILSESNAIIIDRGDLSREIPIYKIPTMQRKIINIARTKNIPTYVATNLLENMILKKDPTRAEVNDVISTLEMGAAGLVLAAETAIGKYPAQTVEMINFLIKEFQVNLKIKK